MPRLGQNALKFFRLITVLWLSFSIVFADANLYAESLQIGSGGLVRETTFDIPASFGKVTEYVQGKSAKTVILIQDAHNSLEAQENIASIVHYLVDSKNVPAVFEEGYEGSVPTDKYFARIEDEEVRRKAAFFLMDRLRLGGAEYAHVTRAKNFQLIGADDQKLYRMNILAYQNMARYADGVTADLRLIEQELLNLIKQKAPDTLRQWLKVKRRYDSDKMDLAEYLNRLITFCLRYHDPEQLKKQFPITTALGDVIKAKEEARHAIYENKAEELFEEIRALEKLLIDSGITDNSISQLFDYYRQTLMLQRMVRFEVSAEEFSDVRKLLFEFSTNDIVRTISDQTGKSLILSTAWENYSRYAVQFYEIAHKRDQAIIQHLRAFFYQSKQAYPAVLVYGGFHTEGLKQIFEREGLSYAIVTPNISQLSKRHQDYYKQLMSEGKHQYEMNDNGANASRPESALIRWDRLNAPLSQNELDTIVRTIEDNPSIDYELLGYEIEKRLMALNKGQGLMSVSRSERRHDYVLSDTLFSLADRLPKNAKIKHIIGLYDNTKTLTPSFDTPLTDEIKAALIALTSVPDNATIINSGDPFLSFIGSSEQGVPGIYADVAQELAEGGANASQLHLVTDGGAHRLGFSESGDLAYHQQIADWPLKKRVHYAHILARSYFEELRERLRNDRENLPEQLKDLDFDELDNEQRRVHKAIHQKSLNSERWNEMPPGENKNIVVHLFEERFDGKSYIYDSGAKMTVVTTDLSGSYQFPIDFYESVDQRVRESFKALPFKTFWGKGYLDIAAKSKVEAVTETFNEHVLENLKLEDNEYVLIVAMGDSGNDIPTLSYNIKGIERAVVLPVFLSHERIYADQLPPNALVADAQETEGALKILDYLRQVQGRRVEDIPVLELKKWESPVAWHKRLRNAYQVEKNSLLQRGLPVLEESKALAQLTDKYVRTIYKQGLKPGFYPEDEGSVALAATGSYGRSEMVSGSDVDLMFVLRDKQRHTPFLDYLVRSFSAVFDKKFDWVEFGAFDRIITEPPSSADERLSFVRSLTESLDMRFVTGDEELYGLAQKNKLTQKAEHQRQWILDMIRFWDDRYQSLGRMEGLHVREPNVKTGLGGMRDYHLSEWVAQLFTGETENPLQEMVRLGMITKEELQSAQYYYSRLLDFRNALSKVSQGRESQAMKLPLQEALAKELGFFEMSYGGVMISPVERMLSSYYYITRSMFLFSVRVMQRVIVRSEPGKLTTLNETIEGTRVVQKEISGWVLRIEKGLEFIEEANPQSFLTFPVGQVPTIEDLFNIFELSAQKEALIDSRLLNLIPPSDETEIASSIDVVSSPTQLRHRAELFKFLNEPKSISYSLWHMKFVGFLSSVFRPFQIMEAHAVHDIEHRYPLDIESMKEIDLLDKLLFNGEMGPENQHLAELLKPSLNWLAQSDALGVLRFSLLTQPIFDKYPYWYERISNYDWPLSQRETALWLVSNRNLLTDKIRRGEFEDKDSFVRDYLAGDESRWHLLLLATVLKVSLLQPDRRWLHLHKIFQATSPVPEVTRIHHNSAGLDVFVRPLKVHGTEYQNIAEIMVESHEGNDQPGHLAAIAGVLAAQNLSILTANISTEDTSGNLLDHFIVRDNAFASFEYKPDHPGWSALRDQLTVDLNAVLNGQKTIAEIFRTRKHSSVISNRPKTFFKIPLKIRFRKSPDLDATQLEIEGPNRPAALYVITSILADEGVNILSSTIDTIGYSNTVGKKIFDTLTIQVNKKSLTGSLQRRINRRLYKTLAKETIHADDLPRSEQRSNDRFRTPDEILTHDLYPHYKTIARRFKPLLDREDYIEIMHTLQQFLLYQNPINFRNPKAMLHLIELVHSPYVDQRLSDAILDFTAVYGLVGDNLNIPKLKQVGSVQSFYLLHQLFLRTSFEITALSLKTKSQGYAAQPDALVFSRDRQQTMIVEVKDYKKMGDVFSPKNNHQMEKYVRAVLTGASMDIYPEEIMSNVPDGIILIIGTQSKEFDTERIRGWFRARVAEARKKIDELGGTIREEFELSDPDFLLYIFDKPVTYAANRKEAEAIEQPNAQVSLSEVSWQRIKSAIDELLSDPAFTRQTGPFNNDLYTYYARVLGDISGYTETTLYENYLRLADNVEERMRIIRDPAQDKLAREKFVHPRSEQRLSESHIDERISLYDLRDNLEASADIRNTYYFSYDDVIRNNRQVDKAFFTLAYQVQNGAVKLVVYDADIDNDALNLLRALDVQITRESLAEVYRQRARIDTGGISHILVSRNKDLLLAQKEYLKAQKIKAYLEASEISYFGALLFGLNTDQAGGLFVRDAHGFYIASDMLREQMDLYQNSLAIEMSA